MAIKHFPDLCSPDIELLKHVAKVVFIFFYICRLTSSVFFEKSLRFAWREEVMNNLIKVEHFMWTAGNQKYVVGFWVGFFCFFLINGNYLLISCKSVIARVFSLSHTGLELSWRLLGSNW